MNNITRRNLEHMCGCSKGQMQYLIGQESVGAGTTPDGRALLFARFYFDRKTGEVQYFGNIQEVPESIKTEYVEGMFKIAWDTKIGRQEASIFKLPEVSDVVRQVLQLTVDLYNSESRLS